jgi:2-succinyl-5-enolpyruvyl-6-hydroxy-3-cyclohexene-1-carboxylate synthase
MARDRTDIATVTYSLLRAFVDELARCGMRAACTSPGSRCAPLVLTLAGEPRLRCYSHVDERCAGFFALGLAKASGLPVAVTCTSGTAAAELLPAVIEAREACVPLLALTADRPPELRENGAGQAIDQLKLFGGAAKWFFEVDVQQADAQHLRWIRTLACRAYWTALQGPPGVVHLNFALREPLIAEEQLAPDHSGRKGGVPYVWRNAGPAPSGTPPSADVGALGDLDALSELVAHARRGVIVAGRYERQAGLGEAASAFALAAGWPLLADPLSGARRAGAAVAHYDALLRDERLAAGANADLVIRVGDLPVSKPLRAWLAGLDADAQIAFDPDGAWQDPASVLSHSLAVEPAAALRRLTAACERSGGALLAGEQDWLASWRSADERAAEAILGVLGDGKLSEPAVASELGVLLPAHATLFVASSMPVRDIETFWPVRADPPRVLCNRGANGIDGTISAAFGAAAHARESGGGPVVLLIGDVAFAHDIGGLLAAARLGLQLTIVLLDNGGGGIFDFLAVSRAPMALAPDTGENLGGHSGRERSATADEVQDVYTRHIATPTGLDFARAAALYGLDHQRVATTAELRAALERALSRSAGCSVVHVQTERAHNVQLHSRVWSAVSHVSGDWPSDRVA